MSYISTSSSTPPIQLGVNALIATLRNHRRLEIESSDTPFGRLTTVDAHACGSTSETSYSADQIGPLSIERLVQSDSRYSLDALLSLLEKNDGGLIGELLFHLSMAHDTQSTTVVDLDDAALGLGLTLVDIDAESSRLDVSGHIVFEIDGPVAPPPPTDPKLPPLDRKQTQAIVDRYQAAKASGDETLADAYHTMNRILTTQDKKGWAQALYTSTKKFLSGDESGQMQKVLAKLDPQQLGQFVDDVVHTLRVTKGFTDHAENIHELRPPQESERKIMEPFLAALRDGKVLSPA